MEPIAHALTAVALSRAGLNKTTQLATPLLLVSGLAPDLDLLALARGPIAYLHSHSATHSLAGTLVLAVVVAGMFWWFGRKHQPAPLQFTRALLVGGIGAATHSVLDVVNSGEVQLLWPFRQKGYAWDLVDVIDPWILVFLLFGLLLPGLFRLVSEEIGARPAGRGPQRGAIAALVLFSLYCGARYLLHERALALLNSRMYHEATPIAAGAFPSPVSPLAWHGVVETENTLEEVEVSLAPGSYFDPERGRTHYKPEASPALEAARATDTAREFLKLARFPKASVEKHAEGYRIELRDLRFPSGMRYRRSFLAIVELDHQLKLTKQELRFTAEP